MKFIFTFILMILSVSLWAQIPAEHIKEAMDITPEEACLSGMCPGFKSRFWDKELNQCRCINGVTKINKIDIESQKCEHSIESAMKGLECKFQAGKCECAIRKVSREREICAQGYCPGLTVRYWDEKSGKCVCMKNRVPQIDISSGVQSGSGGGANQGSLHGASHVGELEGEGTILPGALCYEECKSKSTGLLGLGGKKQGFERKECVECLLKYPGIYRVKREFLPIDGNSVDLNGCVRNVKQSIECPEGTYKFDSSTINSGRVGGKDIETHSGSGSGPSGGGTPSRRSSKASKQ